MSLEKSGASVLPEVYSSGEINRACIRAIVEQNARETADAITAGLNIHQLALDQGDQYEKLLYSVPPEDVVQFVTIYHEEQDAIHQATLDKIRTNITTPLGAAAPAEESNFVKWIGLVTFIFMLYLLIKLLEM